MGHLLRISIALAIVLPAAHWSARWSLLLAASGIVAIVVAIAITPRKSVTSNRTRGRRHPEGRPSLLSQCLRGFFAALVTLSGLAVVTAIQLVLPALHDRWRDLDRDRVERSLTDLEAARQWTDAVSLINDRLKRPASDSWKAALEHRRYHDEVEAATRADVPSTALKGVLTQRLFDKSDATLVTDLLTGLDNRSLVEELKSQLEEDRCRAAEALCEAAKKHIATLIRVADSVSRHPRLSQSWLDQAATIAQQLGVSDSSLDESLSNWKSAQGLRPSTRIVAANVSRNGVVRSLDLLIRDENGPVERLESRDFSVSVNGQPLTSFVVESVTLKRSELQIALVIDCSGSTSGEPLLAAIRGARSFLESLEGHAHLRLWQFSSTVQPLTEWLNSPLVAAEEFPALRSSGGTALLRALELAAADLSKREGSRVLVVFTDGKDSVGGIGLADIIARCRSAQISVFAVSLKTRETDSDLLDHLCHDTGGDVFASDSPGQLVGSFQSLIARLRDRAYRMTILFDAPPAAPVLIEVGGAHAQALSVAL